MLWCLGMFGSASTWTFNVTRQIAAAVKPDQPPRTMFLDVSAPCPAVEAGDGTLIVKTHGSDAARELAERADAIIVTIRDPRDAIVSLMHNNGLPFDVALRMTEVSAWTCSYAMQRGHSPLLLRFEDRFFDDPDTVRRIAALFPARLAAHEGRRIFAALRRDAVDAFIAGMDRLPTTHSHFNKATGRPDIYDVDTGWHKHHAGRDAAVGRWRRDLTDDQRRTIEWRMRVWMEKVGYDTNASRGAPYGLSIGRYGVVD